MRIIKEKTLSEYCKHPRYQKATQAMRSWIFEIRNEDWNSSADVKARYRNVSVINSKRLVFNISGNRYRLVVDVEYKLGLVFVVWFGTHAEYDKIDAKLIKYEDRRY